LDIIILILVDSEVVICKLCNPFFKFIVIIDLFALFPIHYLCLLICLKAAQRNMTCMFEVEDSPVQFY